MRTKTINGNSMRDHDIDRDEAAYSDAGGAIGEMSKVKRAVARSEFSSVHCPIDVVPMRDSADYSRHQSAAARAFSADNIGASRAC